MPAPPPPLPHPTSVTAQFGPYGVFIAPPGEAISMLEPGERVGGPPPRRNWRRRLVRMVLLLGCAGGAAWLIAERRDDVSALATLAIAALLDPYVGRQWPPASARDDARLPDPPSASDREPAPAIAERDSPPAAAPRADPVPPVAATPAPPVAAPSSETDAENPPPPERLPTVAADPADPLQQKALAAGLHPDLSRTLLHRLTPEDFRNAAYAVQSVLKGDAAATPFVWPKERASQRAQFKVRLVAGAPAECRRYVVQIAKDGWETTARPMERCTARQAHRPS